MVVAGHRFDHMVGYARARWQVTACFVGRPLQLWVAIRSPAIWERQRTRERCPDAASPRFGVEEEAREAWTQQDNIGESEGQAKDAAASAEMDLVRGFNRVELAVAWQRWTCWASLSSC